MKLLSVPPPIAISASTKSVEGSLKEKVSCAVSPALRVVLFDEILIVGGVVSAIKFSFIPSLGQAAQYAVPVTNVVGIKPFERLCC